jgi:hypothetical protein
MVMKRNDEDNFWQTDIEAKAGFFRWLCKAAGEPIPDEWTDEEVMQFAEQNCTIKSVSRH